MNPPNNNPLNIIAFFERNLLEAGTFGSVGLSNAVNGPIIAQGTGPHPTTPGAPCESLDSVPSPSNKGCRGSCELVKALLEEVGGELPNVNLLCILSGSGHDNKVNTDHFLKKGHN